MTDIVERLRTDGSYSVCMKAADEIERLRTAVQEAETEYWEQRGLTEQLGKEIERLRAAGKGPMTQRRPRQHWDEHLAWLRTLPCCVCGNNISVEAAHIRMGCREIGKRPTGMGERPSDIYTVPLCQRCHADQHRIGEKQFWSAEPHLPFLLALALACAHGDSELGEMIIRGENE